MVGCWVRVEGRFRRVTPGRAGEVGFPAPLWGARQGNTSRSRREDEEIAAGATHQSDSEKCSSRSGRFAQMVILPVLTDKILTPTWDLGGFGYVWRGYFDPPDPAGHTTETMYYSV